MKRITTLIACALGLLLTGLTGCNGAAAQAGGATAAPTITCADVRAAFDKAAAVVTKTQAAADAQNALLAALPANDPLRVQYGTLLTRAQAALTEAQFVASLAQAAVAAFCPELPQGAPAVTTPTTQPAGNPPASMGVPGPVDTAAPPPTASTQPTGQ